MKIIMVAVSSVNGKITKGSDPNIYKWTSQEDKGLFFLMIAKNNLIVMGSKTYEAARHVIKLKKDKLRIVLTRNPKNYADEEVKGSLEFSSEAPQALVERLEKNGYKKMLLVGGGEINALFLKSKLVDELHLIIEPFIFSRGRDLVVDSELDISLSLIKMIRLNKKGTLHLKYKVNKRGHRPRGPLARRGGENE